MGDHSVGRNRQPSEARTFADELIDDVNALAFEAQAELTKIQEMITKSEELGRRILALKSHNNDIANAGGLLLNIVPTELRAVSSRYAVAVRSLEDYTNKP